MTALADSIVTRRLVLRQPTERDLPQIVREIGNWEVAKWLARVRIRMSPATPGSGWRRSGELASRGAT